MSMLQTGELAPAGADPLIKDTTTQTFMKDVIEESKRLPVLVQFWTPRSAACKQLAPILEKAVKAAKGKVKLVKMDIDKDPAIATQMGIQSLPAVVAFVNGQPADGFMTVLPENQVIAFIERLINGKLDGGDADLLKAAEAAIAAGDVETAADIYGQILAEEPASLPALAGLVRAYVAAGALDEARQTLDLVPEAKRADSAVAAARAALDIAEQAKSVGPITELEQKVAADPLDHQARFDLAVALNSQGKRVEAVDHLIAIVKKDRKWNEDGARKQLVQFFDAWGATDESTIDGRKKLSSVLFA